MLAALALTALVARAVDQPALLDIYKTRFNFRPGPWFAERLALSAPSARSCLIVGASTARQGFDPKILQRWAPEVAFYNAGTTGGTMDVLEIEAQAIARYDLRYRCIIVAVHPWMLRTLGRPEIESTEYSAMLRPEDLMQLTSRYWWDGHQTSLALDYLLPLRRQAPQLNRLVRRGVLDVRERLGLSDLARANYEMFEGELVPTPDNAYPGNPRNLVTNGREQMKAYLDSLGWFNPEHYSSAEPARGFAHALELIVQHADHVLFVSMPSSVLWDETSAKVRSQYVDVIGKFRDHMTVVDCERGLEDSEFVDHAHANDDGRAVLSEAIGRIVQSVLTKSPMPATNRTVCESRP